MTDSAADRLRRLLAKFPQEDVEAFVPVFLLAVGADEPPSQRTLTIVERFAGAAELQPGLSDSQTIERVQYNGAQVGVVAVVTSKYWRPVA